MSQAAPEWFSVRWGGDVVLLLDQRLLPRKEKVLRLAEVEEVARAIEDLSVRGAPAIGVTAAMGIALAATKAKAADLDELGRAVAPAFERLGATRPTAVNLAWGLARMRSVLDAGAASVAQMKQRLVDEAERILEEDIRCCHAIGRHGLESVPEGARILTYCNTGGLATGGWGTALGVIRSAHAEGRVAGVLACETRPVWQGARLTAWECERDGIPCELITDNQVGHWMARGEVDLVVVGADRVAGNGDFANKIGTYGVAVLAHAHGIPFYVAAPSSTFDLSIPSGEGIPIESRAPEEVLEVGAERMAPAAARARNPAFDVTPARLVTAIITELGVLEAPDAAKVRRLFPSNTADAT